MCVLPGGLSTCSWRRGRGSLGPWDLREGQLWACCCICEPGAVGMPVCVQNSLTKFSNKREAGPVGGREDTSSWREPGPVPAAGFGVAVM